MRSTTKYLSGCGGTRGRGGAGSWRSIRVHLAGADRLPARCSVALAVPAALKPLLNTQRPLRTHHRVRVVRAPHVLPHEAADQQRARAAPQRAGLPALGGLAEGKRHWQLGAEVDALAEGRACRAARERAPARAGAGGVSRATARERRGGYSLQAGACVQGRSRTGGARRAATEAVVAGALRLHLAAGRPPTHPCAPGGCRRR